MKFPKPIVVVSSCLEFEKVRYNGQVIPTQIVRDLKSYVKFIKVCPEYEIGLGVPREPIRIVKVDGENRLIQHKTEKDVTEDMNNFSKKFLDSLKEVDGFIFKSKSPTMGVRNIKVYSKLESPNVVERCGGFFAGKISEKYLGYPIEEDDRLRNKKIRDYFLTKLFLFSKYRYFLAKNKLEEFHRDNELLFNFYNSNLSKKLNSGSEDYFELVKKIFERYPSEKKIFDFFNSFKDKVKDKEKYKIFLEEYKDNKISLLTMKKILEIEILDQGILEQSFFNPYPKELISEAEDDRDRDYWK